MKTLISLKDVWKTYVMGDSLVNALQGVTMEVKEGEFIAIAGASGSGKSTLMNLVGCLDLPSKGEIYLDSKNIAEMRESDLAQVRATKIGFVFQQFNLIPNLTALENVMLPLEFQDFDTAYMRKKAEDLLKLVDLADRMHHFPSQLSGGQMQRVAIARALVSEPDIILADEPTGNLDSKTGIFIMEFFSRIHKNGKTIIMVTHDLQLAQFAHKIIHIKDGKIEKTSMR